MGILNIKLPPQLYYEHFIRKKSIAHILYKNYPPQRVGERKFFNSPVTPSATNSISCFNRREPLQKGQEGNGPKEGRLPTD